MFCFCIFCFCYLFLFLQKVKKRYLFFLLCLPKFYNCNIFWKFIFIKHFLFSSMIYKSHVCFNQNLLIIKNSKVCCQESFKLRSSYNLMQMNKIQKNHSFLRMHFKNIKSWVYICLFFKASVQISRKINLLPEKRWIKGTIKLQPIKN